MQRLHYVDWLRVIAIAAVFLFHTLRPFGDDWHINNAERSTVLEDALFFFWTFGLAVLFLLAGAGVRFALRRRTWSTFVRERTARLLVPFVVGTLVLSPVQAFIEAVHRGTYVGPLVSFIGRWAERVLDAFGRGFSPTVFGVGYHLWFLGFLFVISLLALPLCRVLLSGPGRAAAGWLAERSRWPGASLVFAVPIAMIIGIAAPFSRGEHDWFEFGWYFAYFISGFVLFSDERFMAAVRRDVTIALVVAIASTAALTLLDIGTWAASLPERGIDWTYPVMGGLFAIEGWAWTIVMLNIGLRVSALQRPVPERVGDAVLPVYILHQPVILAVALFVVQWPVGILPKWLAIVGVSLPLTLALVELGLRTRIVRALLGARVRPAPAAASDRPIRAGAPS